MTKPIILYGKQPVIIHTTDKGELLVHETESHSKKDIAKALTKILNKPNKNLKLTFNNNTGRVIYNEGCRYLDFNLGFIQK